MTMAPCVCVIPPIDPTAWNGHGKRPGVDGVDMKDVHVPAKEMGIAEYVKIVSKATGVRVTSPAQVGNGFMFVMLQDTRTDGHSVVGAQNAYMECAYNSIASSFAGTEIRGTAIVGVCEVGAYHDAIATDTLVSIASMSAFVTVSVKENIRAYHDVLNEASWVTYDNREGRAGEDMMPTPHQKYVTAIVPAGSTGTVHRADVSFMLDAKDAEKDDGGLKDVAGDAVAETDYARVLGVGTDAELKVVRKHAPWYLLPINWDTLRRLVSAPIGARSHDSVWVHSQYSVARVVRNEGGPAKAAADEPEKAAAADGAKKGKVVIVHTKDVAFSIVTTTSGWEAGDFRRVVLTALVDNDKQVLFDDGSALSSEARTEAHKTVNRVATNLIVPDDDMARVPICGAAFLVFMVYNATRRECILRHMLPSSVHDALASLVLRSVFAADALSGLSAEVETATVDAEDRANNIYIPPADLETAQSRLERLALAEKERQ